jgi:hypothetical protein
MVNDRHVGRWDSWKVGQLEGGTVGRWDSWKVVLHAAPSPFREQS